jgi:type I restriction enzyme S subunit
MEWKNFTLGDICSATQGAQIPKSKQKNTLEAGFRRYLYISDFKHDKKLKFVEDAYPNKIVTTEDIIVSNTGSQGEVYKGIDGILSNNLFKVTIKKEFADRDFLYLFLQSPLFLDFQSKRVLGSTQPHMGHKNFLATPIQLPPIPEQKRIVALLDTVFADLEQTRAKTEQNLKNARELFDSYLQQVFSQRGKGWVEYELKQVTDLKSGVTVKKELEEEYGDVAYIKVSGMSLKGNENEITTSNMFLNKVSIKNSNILPIGTTIFPKRGGAIATNKKRITAIPLCIDLNTMGVIPNQEIVLPHYIYFYFKTIDLLTISNGTTIPQINNYSFDGLKLSLPNLVVQKEEIEKMRHMEEIVLELTQLYKSKIDALDVLKASILQKAFSGELTATAE